MLRSEHCQSIYIHSLCVTHRASIPYSCTGQSGCFSVELDECDVSANVGCFLIGYPVVGSWCWLLVTIVHMCTCSLLTRFTLGTPCALSPAILSPHPLFLRLFCCSLISSAVLHLICCFFTFFCCSLSPSLTLLCHSLTSCVLVFAVCWPTAPWQHRGAEDDSEDSC